VQAELVIWVVILDVNVFVSGLLLLFSVGRWMMLLIILWLLMIWR